MKRIPVLLLLAFVITTAVFSQEIKYELKIKYARSDAGTQADITVLIREGQGPFTCALMTNDPMNGKVLMQSQSFSGKSYVFRDVEPGKYFIKITDSKGLPAGRTVEIINENGQN
jgi:hypothetical protein